MTRRFSVLTLVLLLAVLRAPVLTARAEATPQAPIAFTLSSALDQYASGQHDAAQRWVSALSRPERAQLAWLLMGQGRAWIDRAPKVAHRSSVLAAFALEAAAELAERGQWPARRPGECAGVCIVEWACTLLAERNGSPAAFERAWMRASVSLMNGTREWGALYAPSTQSAPFDDGHGHVQHALAWFAADPDFRLARALALSARFEPTTEQDAPAEGRQLIPRPVTPVIEAPPPSPTVRETSVIRRARMRAALLSELRALTAADAVRTAAGARLAYLQWVGGDYDAAERDALDTSKRAGADNDARYLALFLAGMAAQSNGALARAESHFSAALAARPHSQSASVTLAALRFGRGDAATAYDLAAATLAQRRDDNDPWRMFFYGNFSDWPRLRDTMRAALATGASR